MPKVSDAARVTTKDGAVWRECPCCARLAAMPPDAILCDECTGETSTRSTSGAWSR